MGGKIKSYMLWQPKVRLDLWLQNFCEQQNLFIFCHIFVKRADILDRDKTANDSNKKNYNINNHVITGGFKSIRKQMYKLYID